MRKKRGRKEMVDFCWTHTAQQGADVWQQMPG